MLRKILFNKHLLWNCHANGYFCILKPQTTKVVIIFYSFTMAYKPLLSNTVWPLILSFHNIQPYNSLFAFSPVNLALLILILAQLEKLKRLEKNYFLFPQLATIISS